MNDRNKGGSVTSLNDLTITRSPMPVNIGDLADTLPGGKKVADVDNSGDLARTLIEAGVEGASHSNGKEANIGAYREYICSLVEKAGRQAVEAWKASV